MAKVEKIRLSDDRLQGLIQQAMGAAPQDLTPLEQGEWSAAYAFTIGTEGFILRVAPIEDDFRRDQYACRFSSKNLPVPKIVQISAHESGYYAISEKACGTTIDELAAGQMRRVVPAVLRLLDALRQADVTNSRGFGGWDCEGNGWAPSWKESLLAVNIDTAGSRISGWREKLAASGYGTSQFDRFYGQLQNLLGGVPEVRHVIHSDLLHYNLLVDDGRISGVLDWGCAKYGDFLYDLAWFTFWSSWYPAMLGIDWKGLAFQHYARAGADLQGFDQRLNAYELHIGLDSIVYCAFVEHWDMVSPVMMRLEQVLV